MGIVERFGKKVGQMAERDGNEARSLMLFGYHVQEARLRFFPDKRLPESKRYLALLIMRYMRSVLKGNVPSAMTSLFVPCEPLLAVGWKPYSVEGISAFMTGTRCQDPLIDAAAEDACLCSYHRIFMGGERLGLLPVPPFSIYTNVACDANMITFPHLCEERRIPTFFIDVPYGSGKESVRYVAGQLREMVTFIERQTGKEVRDDVLEELVDRGRKSSSLFREILPLKAERYLGGDLASEMYEIMTDHMLLGSEETQRYWEMTRKDYLCAPPLPPSSLKILWLHTIPFSQEPVREALAFNPHVRIVASEMSYESMLGGESYDDPYLSMASRLVESPFSGEVERRVEKALAVASLVKPDGVVFFNHWGCKATLASSRMVRLALEHAGYPTLVLDGDGCDMRSQSDGQTKTRLSAFLEMLEER